MTFGVQKLVVYALVTVISSGRGITDPIVTGSYMYYRLILYKLVVGIHTVVFIHDTTVQNAVNLVVY